MLILVTGLCAAVGVTACGREDRGPVVARVGSVQIDRAEVDHWARAIAHGVEPVVLGSTRGSSSRRAALSFLLLARWLTGQAAAEGGAVPSATVERSVRERREAEGGEFTHGLKSTGQTVADARLEVQAELAAEAIGRTLTRRAEQITLREELALYRGDPARFQLPEQRLTDLFEHQPSRAAAAAVLRRFRLGPRFVHHATNHELLFLRPTIDREQAAVLRAIFATRVGVANGPMRFQKLWTVFAVRRIVPPRPLPFAIARPRVEATLIAERQRTLTAAYIDRFRRRWRARTRCRAGYVVRECRQYKGSMQGGPTNPFSIG
jgi:foldase protein PrsA